MATNNSINTYVVPTSANEVTMPSQPAFLGVLSGADANVTGAGTGYTVGTNVAFTEIFDQNTDFNTNGTFTAPVTGRYLLSLSIQADNIAAGMNQGAMQLVTSNRTLYVNSESPIACLNAGSSGIIFGGGFVSDMDAADTATCYIVINGGAGDTVDLGTAGTYFSGYLAV